MHSSRPGIRSGLVQAPATAVLVAQFDAGEQTALDLHPFPPGPGGVAWRLTPGTNAILGAGPIGLEAALYARTLAMTCVYERGRRRYAEHLYALGTRAKCSRRFPRMPASLGRGRCAQTTRGDRPGARCFLSGRELAERIIFAAGAESDLLPIASIIGQVLAVRTWRLAQVRAFRRKPGRCPKFRILLRTAAQADSAPPERVAPRQSDMATADVVIDAPAFTASTIGSAKGHPRLASDRGRASRIRSARRIGARSAAIRPSAHAGGRAGLCRSTVLSLTRLGTKRPTRA